MKKIMIVLLIIIVALSFASCATTDVEQKIVDNKSIYVIVEGKSADCYRVIYDKETKVMYHMSAGGYNAGTLTLLVNADGSPKLYKEGVTE